MEERSLVIVGAGPAGSAAARAAAEAGAAPLLIERDATPGRHNACGGIASAAFATRLGLDDQVVEARIRRTILRVDGQETAFAGKRPSYISFRRAVFDAALALQAQDAGAELLAGTRAVAVEPATGTLRLRDEATGSERELAARLLILADGPRTLAADSLGIGYKAGQDVRSAMYWELDGAFADGETMEIVVDSTSGTTGYFWVFPKRGRVQVGVGKPLHARGEPLRDRLERFIDSRDDLRGRTLVARNAGLVPGAPSRRLVADGAMVVGDAAGLVNPLTGGGIAFALHSGALAGRVAAEAVRAGRTDGRALRRYARRFWASPHGAWLWAMTAWRRRLERRDDAPRAYGRALRRYFGLFHRLRWVVGRLLLRG